MAALVLAVVLLMLGIDWLTGGPSRSWVLGSAELAIATDPADAELLIDGVLLGTTPITVRVTPGAHTLQVRHRYHPPHVEHLALERDQRLQRSIALEPAQGALLVASNPKGAQVTLDGVAQDGVTPLMIDPVTAGLREVVVRLPGRRAVRLTPEVLPGARVEVSAELERARTGVLRVQATPAGAEVELIDGYGARHRPGTPVPEGSYTLRVTRTGHRPEERTVIITPGERTETIALEALSGHLELTVEPADARVTVTSGRGSGARSHDYVRGMVLPAGPVTVEVRAPGYRTERRTLQMGEGPLHATVRLHRFEGSPGDRIQDRLAVGGEAPVMVVIPTGTFVMGPGTRAIVLSTPFAMGVHEVTRGDWARYASATGRSIPPAREDETDRHPIDRVSHEDAAAYAAWLSAQTGARYRLPSATEWEYAARAGTTGDYPGGADAASLCTVGNVADASLAKRYRSYATVACDDGRIRAAPIGQYAPNRWGLHDVIGNVGEWTASCWDSAPGSPPEDDGACGSHAVRGGAWDTAAAGATLAAGEPASSAGDGRGFRLLREL